MTLWTIRYTDSAGSYRQGLYAKREMADLNVRLCRAAGIDAVVEEA